MPTGYTADIAKGISFEHFVWSCARAFGALVTMRDDPMDAPIPERFEPSDYYEKRIATLKSELALLNAMSEAESESAAAADYDGKLAYHSEQIKEDAELKTKYEAMLAQARAWEPPTADHLGLKKLMVEQIEQSIRFDCESQYHHDAILNLARESGEAWRARRQEEVIGEIGRCAKHHEEEVARVESRNQWIAALRNSLTAQEVA